MTANASVLVLDIPLFFSLFISIFANSSISFFQELSLLKEIFFFGLFFFKFFFFKFNFFYDLGT